MNVEAVLRSKGRGVTVAHHTDAVSSVVRLLAAKRIGAVVVNDGNETMVGVFSERDLVNALARYDSSALHREVGELMSSPVITCTASEPIETVLARMTHHRIRHVPVTEGGVLAGIISIGDLVQHRLVEKETEANVLLDIARMRA